jgi:hypothetical protein
MARKAPAFEGIQQSPRITAAGHFRRSPVGARKPRRAGRRCPIRLGNDVPNQVAGDAAAVRPGSGPLSEPNPVHGPGRNAASRFDPDRSGQGATREGAPAPPLGKACHPHRSERRVQKAGRKRRGTARPGSGAVTGQDRAWTVRRHPTWPARRRPNAASFRSGQPSKSKSRGGRCSNQSRS